MSTTIRRSDRSTNATCRARKRSMTEGVISRVMDRFFRAPSPDRRAVADRGGVERSPTLSGCFVSGPAATPTMLSVRQRLVDRAQARASWTTENYDADLRAPRRQAHSAGSLLNSARHRESRPRSSPSPLPPSPRTASQGSTSEGRKASVHRNGRHCSRSRCRWRSSRCCRLFVERSAA